MSQAPDTAPPRKPIPTVMLTGEVEREYVAKLRAILQSARLNVHFPDARRLKAHVEAMSPDIHRGLYPGLEIDLRSGLPTYKEWTRILTDCQLAEQLLEELGARSRLERRAAERDDPIYGKQLLKHHYYSALCGRRLAPLGEMKVALRKVDPKLQTAWFNVVLDKLDASGLFVRFTIDLAQQSSVWNRALVRLTEDTALHTEEFQSLIYRFTSLDAEFTFFKLVTFGHLQVERVVKGTVGPVIFSGREGPGALAALVAKRQRGLIACFPLDMVACDLAADRDNDPLDDPMSAHLSEEARVDYEKTRKQLGYCVFKDRKFVVTENLLADLRALCESLGTKNILKTLKLRGAAARAG